MMTLGVVSEVGLSRQVPPKSYPGRSGQAFPTKKTACLGSLTLLKNSNMDPTWHRRWPKKHPKAPKSHTTRTSVHTSLLPELQHGPDLALKTTKEVPKNAQERHTHRCTLPLLWRSIMDPNWRRRRKKCFQGAPKSHTTRNPVPSSKAPTWTIFGADDGQEAKKHPKAAQHAPQCTRPSFHGSNMNQCGAQDDPRGA